VQIQVRHRQCGKAASCACGVAMRENNLVLILDGCNKTAGIRPLTHFESAQYLRDFTNAGITTDHKNKYKVSEHYLITTTYRLTDIRKDGGRRTD